MAYDNTAVPVARSQQMLRELLLKHEGSSVAFVSDPPNEGFHARVPIDGVTYTIRVMATMREVKAKQIKGRHYMGRWIPPRTDTQEREQECARIWRVLYYHMKGIFEAADSGVMEFREMMLPYVVTKDGKTVGEHIIPRLEAAITNPARLLGA